MDTEENQLQTLVNEHWTGDEDTLTSCILDMFINRVKSHILEEGDNGIQLTARSLSSEEDIAVLSLRLISHRSDEDLGLYIKNILMPIDLPPEKFKQIAELNNTILKFIRLYHDNVDIRKVTEESLDIALTFFDNVLDAQKADYMSVVARQNGQPFLLQINKISEEQAREMISAQHENTPKH